MESADAKRPVRSTRSGELDLFEYQGKQLFARYGISVSDGETAKTVDEAVAVAEKLGYPVVLKAQVQVGGRGKAGGIQFAKDADECRGHAEYILGMDIKGHVVRLCWIEKPVDIAQEYYASFTLDRSAKQHLGMLSAQGGMDIEQVAADTPDAVARIHVDPVDGLSDAQCRAWIAAAGLDAAYTDGLAAMLTTLWGAYVEADADLMEINPLVITKDDRVHALDAKVTLDDNSVFRHPEYEEYRKTQERDEREQAAFEKGLQYVGLDGYVGIIANGAGLAMSTVDIVSQVGGKPANFLDIGGGANAEVMANALEVIDGDENVRTIFINIFGGITKGEEVANGIVQALDRIDIDAPIVIRLDGTNADQGREILEPHLSHALQMQPTMLEAARRAVELAQARGASS
jgi:succinyl-CoA synthetase beta subunit